jgi:hypothetical protein
LRPVGLRRHEFGTSARGFPRYRLSVDEARAVIDRLDRIEALERDGAPPGVLIEELRGLVQAAEAWVSLEGDEHARGLVHTCGSRLAIASIMDGAAGEARGS